MNTLLRVAVIFPALCLLGCGPSGTTIKSPTMIQSPVNSGQPANPQPAQTDVPANTPNQTQPAKTAPKTAKSKAAENPLADEDPRNIFEIAGEAPTVSIGSPSETAQVDRFTVGDFTPGSDSTTFTVEGGVAKSTAQTSKSSSFKLPSGFTELPEYGYSDQGLPLRIRGDKSGALMAFIPAGVAHVGSDDCPDEARPAFTPFLEAYYIDINEVTLEQYAKFRDDIKQKKNSRVQAPMNDGSDPEQPALGLPWAIAQGFAHWQGKELPTEAEWENAARGPDGWRTPWGNGRAVWPKPRTPETIVAVQSFPTDQTPTGIFDLAGNAREWCLDNYSDTAHQEGASASPKLQHNWSGPKKGSSTKVVKGNGPDWSAWQREGRVAADRHPDVGFRCVLRVNVPSSTSGGN